MKDVTEELKQILDDPELPISPEFLQRLLVRLTESQMNCIECGGKTDVVDTQKYSMYVWRRRRCLICDHRMNTHENFVEDSQNSRSKNRNGANEDSDGRC